MSKATFEEKIFCWKILLFGFSFSSYLILLSILAEQNQKRWRKDEKNLWYLYTLFERSIYIHFWWKDSQSVFACCLCYKWNGWHDTNRLEGWMFYLNFFRSRQKKKESTGREFNKLIQFEIQSTIERASGRGRERESELAVTMKTFLDTDTCMHTSAKGFDKRTAMKLSKHWIFDWRVSSLCLRWLCLGKVRPSK